MDVTNDLLIFGAGQYGLVAKEVAEAMGCFDKIDFLDDKNDLAIGKLDDYMKFTEYKNAFVAIGNPSIRSSYIKKLESCYQLVNLIHPISHISPSAKLGHGCIVEPFATVSTGAAIRNGCIIMAHAIVGHNATVGDCSQLKYGCIIPENVTVPAMSKVPCNSVYTIPPRCPDEHKFEDGM